MKKIALIGHLAIGKDAFDGQTVKTRTVYSGLRAKLGDKVIAVDTQKKSKPIGLFMQTLRCLHKADKVIIMLSRNGLRLYLPIMYQFVRLCHGEVYHCVIGGNDDELLQKNPQWIKYLSSFKVNWYESQTLVLEMKEKGIANAKYLPNFKDITPLSLEELEEEEKRFIKPHVYKFCTFSRVMKEKGITDAIISVEKLCKEKRINARLDIYGPIEESYRAEFEELLRNTETSEYRGVIAPNRSVETMKEYYGLLFPSSFYGEGFPGTLVDAMCAGVPAIASDWHFNAEIITDGIDGIIYGKPAYPTLYDALLWAVQHEDEFIKYRECFWKKAESYLVEKNIGTILREMKVGVET